MDREKQKQSLYFKRARVEMAYKMPGSVNYYVRQVVWNWTTDDDYGPGAAAHFFENSMLPKNLSLGKEYMLTMTASISGEDDDEGYLIATYKSETKETDRNWYLYKRLEQSVYETQQQEVPEIDIDRKNH